MKLSGKPSPHCWNNSCVRVKDGDRNSRAPALREWLKYVSFGESNY